MYDQSRNLIDRPIDPISSFVIHRFPLSGLYRGLDAVNYSIVLIHNQPLASQERINAVIQIFSNYEMLFL